MSITSMRTKLGRNALLAILVIGGLAILLPVFFSGAGTGGGRSPEDEERQAIVKEQGEVVARVGDQQITRGEVNAVYDRAAGARDITPMQRHENAPRVLESLQEQALLTSEARKQGISVSGDEVKKEVNARVEAESARMGIDALQGAEKRQYAARVRADVESQRGEIRNDLLLQKMVDKLKQSISLDSKDLKPDEVEVHARHILIGWKGSDASAPDIKRTKAEAKALAEKLTKEAKANPAGFPALADQNTEDPSGKGQGGDLSWFSRQTMVKPFADAAFKAKAGEVVGPVETNFGYHVIKVEDRRVAEARAMQEVQKFLDEKKKTAKLEILAPDFKAAQAYDEMAQSPAKDKKERDEKRAKVIAAYETALQSRKRDAALYARLGQLYKDAGQTDKAMTAYQEAASLPNPSAETHLALGDLYREKKDKEKALDHYQKAGRMAGDNMMIHVMLQMAYHDMGEKALAEQQSQRLQNAQRTQGMPMMPPGG